MNAHLQPLPRIDMNRARLRVERERAQPAGPVGAHVLERRAVLGALALCGRADGGGGGAGGVGVGALWGAGWGWGAGGAWVLGGQ